MHDPINHPPGFRARRGVNWVFLGLMYGFFYMSRYNFSAISVGIGERFGWTNTQYGGIVSAGVLTYGFAVLLNGPLADRIGGKRAILIGSVGAAVFNFLFGLCFIFLARPAVWRGGVVVQPAVLAHGMTTTTLLATFSALWACNHYFQSFGALSIVKINAAWFHVRERGVFAGIFGVMIQGGRQLAFVVSPFILAHLPWQYCFWIPAAILAVMFFANWRLVSNSPADAGFEYHTADETREEAARPATIGFVLHKVFASPAMWLIALSSMCIGMVRNSIDHWWARYVGTVFHVPAAGLSGFWPYELAAWTMPLAAIAGGLAAGNASDRLFGSRRAPVICLAFVGQGLCLLALWWLLRSAWLGCLMLVLLSFFIQSAHSLVGGAASMDFGGKKAVATAAGLFDGAQYLAGAIVGWGMGALLDAYRDPKLPGVEYDVWPLLPLPFTIVGAVLIGRLWNALPGGTTTPRPRLDPAALKRRLGQVHALERLILAGYGLGAGALSVIALILPQPLAHETVGHYLLPGALLMSQLHAGARLGLALVALIAAQMPRPARPLVVAVALGLLASVVGPVFSYLTRAIPWPELRGVRTGLILDGMVAAVLLATTIARSRLRAADPA